MKPIEALYNIKDSDHKLIEVNALIVPFKDSSDLVVGVELNFGHKKIFFNAMEDDSIELSHKPPNELDIFKKNVSKEWPWINALGKGILWYWVMTNNQGYQDAFQIDFSNSAEDDNYRIQFLAIGSGIKIYEVKKDS